MPLKMKRKDLDDVNDDFSDFSLSSPATKIRRLDAELPPIMEEDETGVPMAFDEPRFEPESLVNRVGPIIEEIPDNEERAIVLFKPMNASLLQSPSPYSLSVDSDLIAGFRNQVLRSNSSNQLKSSKEDEEEKENKNQGKTNENMAVIPWVPSKFVQDLQEDSSDLMEAEESEATTMEIEEETIPSNNGVNVTTMGMWPQHCVVPEPPQNTSTPIVWFR